MAEQSTLRHLRVARAVTARAATARVERGTDVDERDRAAYWARLQALRAERQRLRAG